MTFITSPDTLYTRQLQCKITLQSGEFKQGANTKLVDNLTINATISKSLNNNFTQQASVIIYGMNKSDIAALSTLGYLPLSYELNRIEIYAQYEGDALALAYSGYITKAWAEFANPSRPMYFECQTTYQDAINDATNFSNKGNISTEDVFKLYADKLGCSFSNNNVTGQLNNVILTGSPIAQLQQLAKQTQTSCVVDNGILKIAPQGQAFSNEILNINSGSGLISYPVIDVWGVRFRMRYNPILQIGQYVKLQTIVTLPTPTPIPQVFNNQWYVYHMDSSLNNRHENFYTDVRCSYNNLIGSGVA